MYYYNARYYDPHLGSFITPDPAMDGLNHYSYANSNPIKYTDPTGLSLDYSDPSSAPDDYDDSGDYAVTYPDYSNTSSAPTYSPLENTSSITPYTPPTSLPVHPDYSNPSGAPVQPPRQADYSDPSRAPTHPTIPSFTPNDDDPIVWPLGPEHGIGPNPGQRYGPRILRGQHQFHASVDMPARWGTPIMSYRNGVVVNTGFNPYYGNFIAVQHRDGTISIYSHCANFVAQIGDPVSAGQIIATVGNTFTTPGYSSGPHLDFMIRTDGFYTPVGAGTAAQNGHPVTVNPINLLP